MVDVKNWKVGIDVDPNQNYLSPNILKFVSKNLIELEFKIWRKNFIYFSANKFILMKKLTA